MRRFDMDDAAGVVGMDPVEAQVAVVDANTAGGMEDPAIAVDDGQPGMHVIGRSLGGVASHAVDRLARDPRVHHPQGAGQDQDQDDDEKSAHDTSGSHMREVLEAPPRSCHTGRYCKAKRDEGRMP